MKSVQKSLLLLALTITLNNCAMANEGDPTPSTNVYVEPPMSTPLKALRHQAVKMIRYNGTNQARVLIAKYGKEHGYPEEYFYAMALMFMSLHSFREAGQFLQDGLKKYPNSFDLHLTAAQNWICVDEPDLAEPELNICAKLKPGAQAIYADRAFLAYTREDYKEALKQSDLALAKGPGTKQIWRNRSCILRNMKRDKEALVAIDKAIQLCEPNARWDLLRMRGTERQLLKQYKEAIEDFKLVVLGDHEHAYNYETRIGECYLAMNQTKEALRFFDKAILGKSDYFAAHRGRLTCLTRLNDKRAAAEESKFINETHRDLGPGK